MRSIRMPARVNSNDTRKSTGQTGVRILAKLAKALKVPVGELLE